METIGERLARLRATKALSQGALAKAAGLKSQGTIGNIEAGTRGYGESIVDIARALGVSPEYLRCETDDDGLTPSPAPAPRETPGDDPSGPPDLVIAQYSAGGAMGHGFALEENPPGLIKSWRVDGEWLRLNVPHYSSVHNLCIVTGFGPSMKPRYNPGDPLLCDTGVTEVQADGVYFFRVDGHGFIKQIQRIPTEKGLILRAKSFNKDYEPFDITAKMDFQVFGKILTAWRSEQF